MISLAENVQNQFLRLIGYVRYQVLERQFIHTMRIGLVATTLFLALFAGLASINPIIGFGIVGLVGGILVLVFIYNHMEIGVLLLMVTTTIANPPIPRDITTTLLLLLVLTLFWLIKMLVAQRSFKSVIAAPPNRIVPIFIAIVGISFVWSNAYVDPIVEYVMADRFLPRLVTMIVIMLSPVAMLLFGNFMRTMRAIKAAIWYFLIYGGIMMTPRILNIYLPPVFNTFGQFPAWICIFALGQLLYNQKIDWRHRTFLVAIIGGWVYIQMGLGISWISGWLPMVMGMGIIMFLRSKVLILILVAAVMVGAAANIDAINAILEAETEESGEARAEAGNISFDIANQHFLFGTGPAGYFFYMWVYVGGLFQLSHNNYIDIYAQTGILGFITFIALWISIGVTVWLAYRKVPRKGFEGGLAASLVAAYFISLLAMMLGDWVTPFTYTQTMRGLAYTVWHWLWMGLAIALLHIARTTPLNTETGEATSDVT